MPHIYIYKTIRGSFCHTVKVGSAKKQGIPDRLVFPAKPLPPTPTISRAWDSNKTHTLAFRGSEGKGVLGVCVCVFSFHFTQYYDTNLKNKVHFLSFPSQVFKGTMKINTTSKVCCPGSPVCSLSKQPPRDAPGSEQVPVDSRETREWKQLSTASWLSSASEGRGRCLKDNEETILCSLSPAKDFAWRAVGCFVFVQKDFCARFLGWSSFP